MRGNLIHLLLVQCCHTCWIIQTELFSGSVRESRCERGDREGNPKKEVERVSSVELKNLESRIGEAKLEDVT